MRPRLGRTPTTFYCRAQCGQVEPHHQYPERVHAESKPPTLWYDRPLVANVLGGLIVGCLIWIVPWLISEGTKAKVPLRVYLIVAAAALVLSSATIPVWRRATWWNLWAFLKWAAAIRPATASKRQELLDSGYATRQGELDEARKNARQPRWNIRAEDHLRGDTALHWIRNQGYAGYDIEVTTDSTEFVLDGDVFFPGPIETNIGKNFRGAPTGKGLRDGVTFHVSWRDRDGLNYERNIFAPPEDIWGNQIRALELSHVAELRSKDDEIAELRRVIAEAAAKRETTTQQGKEIVDKILSGPPKPPPPPLPRPRWLIAPAPSEEPNEYVLRNSVPRSVAREVRLEADPEFKILNAGHWKDLSVTEGEASVGSFVGVFTSQGNTFGVHFNVSWYDEKGELQLLPLFLGGPNQTSKLVDRNLNI